MASTVAANAPFRVRPASCMTLFLALCVGTQVHAQQLPPIPLDTVHITGSRAMAGAAAATRSVEIVERRQIAAMPVRSVNEVLARALGVDLQARSPAQADISIRGSGFEQVLIMVDGVPVNDGQTGHFHLDLAVPLEAIERVEVLRGPAAALYGSAAAGGVVNIVTQGGAPGLTARAQGGSFGSAAVGADVRLGNQRSGTGTGRSPSGHLSVDYDRSDGHRPGTDFTSLQARAAMAAPVAGGALNASAGWAARDFGADNFYAPFDSWEETRTATATVDWRGGSAAWSVQPRLAFRQHEDDFTLVRDDPSLYRNVHTSRQASGEVLVRWAPAGSGMRAAAGLEGALATLESTNLGDRQEDRAAVFAELATGDVATRLVTAGARVDHHSTFGTFVSPSIAGGISLVPAVRLRASAARGFRAPNWTDRYYRDPANIGDPDLDAEKFWTAEAGVAWQAATLVTVDVAAFVRQADDLIDWARPTGAGDTEPWRTMNVERARFTGLESSLVGSTGPVTLTLRGTLLHVDATVTPGLESKYALRPLTRTASAEAAFTIPGGLDADLRAAYFHRDSSDAWHLIDLRVGRALGDFEFFADVRNATGTAYDDVTGRPAPGRAFSVGGRYARD